MILADFVNSAAQTANRTLIATDLCSGSEIMAVYCRALRVRRPAELRVNYRGLSEIVRGPEQIRPPVVNTISGRACRLRFNLVRCRLGRFHS